MPLLWRQSRKRAAAELGSSMACIPAMPSGYWTVPTIACFAAQFGKLAEVSGVIQAQRRFAEQAAQMAAFWRSR
jgi:hypothetical protein